MASRGDLGPTDRGISLSYAPADRERVLPLVRAFERAGWSAVEGGRDEASDRALCAIVLWSHDSVGSDSVQAEADRARKRTILLPVILDDVPVPQAFRQMQAANLVGWNGGDHPELNALIGAATLLARSSQQTGQPSREANRVPAGLLDSARREMHIKIVYYGPPSKAKSKSLMHLYENMSADRRGKLISLPIESDEPAILFDCRPRGFGQPGGLGVRLYLYGVPAQEWYDQSRRLALKNASGVVFVADPATARIADNLASLEDLRGTLAGLGVDSDEMPLVFQYDTSDRLATFDIDRLRSELNLRGAPERVTVATQGVGVFECLQTIVRLVLLRSNYPERAPLLEMPVPR